MLQKKKGLCDLVVIDYLHLMERKGRAGETMDQLVGRNIEGAKQVAVDANCPTQPDIILPLRLQMLITADHLLDTNR